MPKDPRHPPPAPLPPSSRSGIDRREATGFERTSASPEEVARYIAEFSAELSSLARESNLELLAYLLDMARLEALELARTRGVGR